MVLIKTPEIFILAWTGVWSIISYVQFFWDKLSAQMGWWRVSERKLLLTALIGGALGAKIGQRMFRHKTWKEPFRRNLDRILVVNLACTIALFFPRVRAFVASIPEIAASL